MRTLAAIILLISSAGSAMAQAPVFTAHYYMLQPEKWLDKNVTLNVGSVKLTDSAATKDGYKEVQLYTANSNLDGGYMRALVTPAALERVVKLCGTQVYEYVSENRMHPVQGLFIKDGDHYAVKIDK